MDALKVQVFNPPCRSHRLQSDNIVVSQADLDYLHRVIKRTNSYPEELAREIMTPEMQRRGSNDFETSGNSESAAVANEEDEINYWRDQCRRQHKLSTADRDVVQLALLKLSIAERDIAQLRKLVPRMNTGEINSCDQEGKCPIHYAALYGRKEVLQILVEYDADINCLSKDGRTALDYAVKEGNFDVAQFLIDHGAQVKSIVNGIRNSSLNISDRLAPSLKRSRAYTSPPMGGQYEHKVKSCNGPTEQTEYAPPP